MPEINKKIFFNNTIIVKERENIIRLQWCAELISNINIWKLYVQFPWHDQI